jgi:hypothetical protein
VAQDVERVGSSRVARGQDLDRLPVLERHAQVLDVAVRADQNGLLGQLRADRGSRVEPRRAVGSSSSEESGRTTFMEDQDTSLPRDDDRNEELDDSPAPDPEEGESDAQDDPGAD